MSDLWVKECGQWQEKEEFREKVKAYLTEKPRTEPRYLLALYTDRFVCASVQKLQELKTLDKQQELTILDALLNDAGRLLELRVFDQDRELWAHRTMLGQPFCWRKADDSLLSEQNRQRHCLETRQLLDIDSDHPSDEPALYGGRPLRSTGRGTYELPIEKRQNAVILVSYIRYDEIGMAHVVDYRLKGFGTLAEAKEHKGGEKQ